jgi:radical SAM/Cys-rich protein
MKSLFSLHNELADSKRQIEFLEQDRHLPFYLQLEGSNLFPLKPYQIENFQINLGKMCNQVCKHCHVDAGPDRKEIMSRQTMEECLSVLRDHPNFSTVDLTGGAPELNPNFRWFVEEISKLGKHVMTRCNLTIILANKRFTDLPEFYKKCNVEVVASLPFYTEERSDRQRGKGVFKDSIKALEMLNAVGYGKPGTDLLLNLVYNPAGAFLPPSQVALEKEYKEVLQKDYGISFNNLYVITNMPISRYLQYLLVSGNYERYMEKLVNAFNPAAAINVMCRNTLSVGWNGFIYDCDFNQMLDLKVNCKTSQHITDFNLHVLKQRDIVINQHCYGCTAGSGSSCGGHLT